MIPESPDFESLLGNVRDKNDILREAVAPEFIPAELKTRPRPNFGQQKTPPLAGFRYFVRTGIAPELATPALPTCNLHNRYAHEHFA